MATCDVCGMRDGNMVFPVVGARLTWRDRRAGRQVAKLVLCRGCLGDLARHADRRAQAATERLSA